MRNRKTTMANLEKLLSAVGATRDLIWRKDQLGNSYPVLSDYGAKFYKKLVRLLKGADMVAGTNSHIDSMIDGLATTSPEFEREWNTTLKVGFSYLGKYIEQIITIKDCYIVLDEYYDTWECQTKEPININGEDYVFRVWGTIDTCGNFRTSGVVNADGQMAAFGVTPIVLIKDDNGNIDDVDVLDCQ